MGCGMNGSRGVCAVKVAHQVNSKGGRGPAVKVKPMAGKSVKLA